MRHVVPITFNNETEIQKKLATYTKRNTRINIIRASAFIMNHTDIRGEIPLFCADVPCAYFISTCTKTKQNDKIRLL